MLVLASVRLWQCACDGALVCYQRFLYNYRRRTADQVCVAWYILQHLKAIRFYLGYEPAGVHKQWPSLYVTTPKLFIDFVTHTQWISLFYNVDCLFVCLFIATRAIFSYLVAVIIAGDEAANLGLCSALRAFEQVGVFIVPHLLRLGTSVYTFSSERPAPTSHSGIRTPWRKDNQIFAPDALTTAPRGRLIILTEFLKVTE
jgi:hypothetical protein